VDETSKYQELISMVKMENLSSALIETTDNNTTSLSRIYNEQTDVKEIAIFILVGHFIIFGNVTSILVFWRRRHFLKRSTILLINLTAADLLVGLVVIFTILGDFIPKDDNSSIKDVHFKIIVPFDAFAGMSSIFFLAAISLEKSHAILRPLRHVAMPTSFYVIGVCSVWFLTGFLSGLLLLSLCGFLNNHVTDIVISSFIGLALVITCVSYATIWVKFSRRIFVPHNTATEMNKKLVKTLFIVTVLSLISWLPFHIIFTLLQLFPNIPISDSTVIITRLLQFANSLLNPIVYNLRMPEFRKALMNLICSCAIRDRPKANIRLVSLKSSSGQDDVSLSKVHVMK